MHCPICEKDISDTWMCMNIDDELTDSRHYFRVKEVPYSNQWVMVCTRKGLSVTDNISATKFFDNVDDAYDFAMQLSKLSMFI